MRRGYTEFLQDTQVISSDRTRPAGASARSEVPVFVLRTVSPEPTGSRLLPALEFRTLPDRVFRNV